MRDSTNVIIPDHQLDKIIDVIKGSQDILTPGEVALLAAIIGALAAIIPQLITNYLNHRKDLLKKKSELVAEERSISNTIAELYNMLARNKIIFEAWYRAHIIADDEKYIDENYRQTLIYSQKIEDCYEKIRIAKSEYFKTVTHFVNLHSKNDKILELLDKIKNYNIHPKVPDFLNCHTYEEVYIERDKEIAREKKEYLDLFKVSSQRKHVSRPTLFFGYGGIF